MKEKFHSRKFFFDDICKLNWTPKMPEGVEMGFRLKFIIKVVSLSYHLTLYSSFRFENCEKAYL